MTDTDELAGRLEAGDPGPMLIEAAAKLRALKEALDGALNLATRLNVSEAMHATALRAAEATIAKQAQELAEMREALRELIGLIGRVMAPGYDNIALQEARSLSNTKGSDDDR